MVESVGPNWKSGDIVFITVEEKFQSTLTNDKLLFIVSSLFIIP